MSDGSCAIPTKRAPNRSVRLALAVQRVHFFGDICSLLFSYFIAFLSRFPVSMTDVSHGRVYFDSAYASVYFRKAPVYLFLIAIVLTFSYALLGMYDGHRRIHRTPLLWNALVGNGIAIGAVAIYLFFSKSTWHMRGFIPLVLLINIPMTVLVRHVVNSVVRWARHRHPSLRTRALLIGLNADADLVETWAKHGQLKGCDIAERVASPATVEAIRQQLPLLLRSEIDVVFLIDRGMDVDRIMDIVRICARSNKTIKVLFPRFLALHNPFGYGDRIDGLPIVHFSALDFSHSDAWFRRICSRLAAGVLLIPFALIHLVVGMLVKLDSCGPVLFIQDRIGKDGCVFRMLKYRTMCLDAESRIEELREMNETDGALFKMRDDPRVTCLGRFLRRSSIDELPQLINIFRGEMRFVGPRPLPVQDLHGYEADWRFMRQSCPPGITCLWQVAGRSCVGFDDMCLLDIWYALNRNWMLDTLIMIRTVWVVAFRSGAY